MKISNYMIAEDNICSSNKSYNKTPNLCIIFHLQSMIMKDISRSLSSREKMAVAVRISGPLKSVGFLLSTLHICYLRANFKQPRQRCHKEMACSCNLGVHRMETSSSIWTIKPRINTERHTPLMRIKLEHRDNLLSLVLLNHPPHSKTVPKTTI